MRSSRVIGGLGIVAASLGVALTASPAGALTTVCMARTPATAGKVPWTLRQASGLTSLPGKDDVLYTHNDRGLRDSPAPGEDTANAAVWAIKPDGTPLARYRLTAGLGGPPIPYFDTEAIGHDPAGHLVLADTGTNVDHRVVVALYRFTPPAIDPNKAYVEQDVAAEIIPIAYYNSATTQTQVQLNVESMAIDAAGSAWFIPRKSGKPYAYVATAGDAQRGLGDERSGPRGAVVAAGRGRAGDGRLDLADERHDGRQDHDDDLRLPAEQWQRRDRAGRRAGLHRGDGREGEGRGLRRGDRGARRRELHHPGRRFEERAQRQRVGGLVLHALTVAHGGAVAVLN